MMYYSGLLKTYCLYTFTIVVFLINRLPSISLNHESINFKLYGKHLDCSRLSVFSLKCFPNIWDIKKNNFGTTTKVTNVYFHLLVEYFSPDMWSSMNKSFPFRLLYHTPHPQVLASIRFSLIGHPYHPSMFI